MTAKTEKHPLFFAYFLRKSLHKKEFRCKNLIKSFFSLKKINRSSNMREVSIFNRVFQICLVFFILLLSIVFAQASQDKIKQSLIYQSVINGSKDAFRNAIDKKHVDVNFVYPESNQTILHYVILSPNRKKKRNYLEGLEMILDEMLLERDSKIDTQNKEMNTALHLAIMTMQTKEALMLIEKGASVKLKNSQGKTPLDLANKLNLKEVIKAITPEVLSKSLERPASEILLDISTDKPDYKKFYEAIIGGDKELFERILDQIPNRGINMANQETGYTLLHYIILAPDRRSNLNIKNKNYLKGIEMILDRNANMDAQAYNGNTPLHLAILSLQVEEALLLIRRGANIHLENYMGQTPIYLSSILGLKKVAQKLLDKGADINKTDIYGNTALHKLAKGTSEDMVKFILKNNAHPDISNFSDQVPLQIALLTQLRNAEYDYKEYQQYEKLLRDRSKIRDPEELNKLVQFLKSRKGQHLIHMKIPFPDKGSQMKSTYNIINEIKKYIRRGSDTGFKNKCKDSFDSSRDSSS